jgi:protein-S-isoprenylcysteine O-methyltransferase Ste14
MERYIIFGILSIGIIAVSWRTLFNIKSHGFYRFFSWECMAWLIAANYKVWFDDPFSPKQILSWIFLIISGYLVIAGVIMMKKIGKPKQTGDKKTLYAFEETSELIDQGIFKYIRHPLYASLLFLTWGIFMKDTTIELLIVSVLSTLFLFLTALYDEKECIAHFGDKYKAYMKRSKRFLPFLI